MTIPSNGIISVPSNHPVDETVEDLRIFCNPRASRFSRWWITAARPQKWE